MRYSTCLMAMLPSTPIAEEAHTWANLWPHLLLAFGLAFGVTNFAIGVIREAKHDNGVPSMIIGSFGFFLSWELYT